MIDHTELALLKSEELREQVEKDIEQDYYPSPFTPPKVELNEIYSDLVESLKSEAFKMEANGIVSVSFNLTPIVSSSVINHDQWYKITCTGNAVWISADGA
jgi:hypothetical protein